MQESRERLATMAEQLMKRQAQVERLSAERSSLRLQLKEHVQQQQVQCDIVCRKRCEWDGSRAVKELQEQLRRERARRSSTLMDSDRYGSTELTVCHASNISEGEHELDDLSLDKTESGLRVRPVERRRRVRTRLSSSSQLQHQLAMSAPLSVARAVGFMDQIGSTAVGLLRRHPGARLMFVAYAALIHLWLVFVMYHFAHHNLQ